MGLVFLTRLQLLLFPFRVAYLGSVAVGTFSTYSAFNTMPSAEFSRLCDVLHVRLTLTCLLLAKTIRPPNRPELHNSGPDEEEWLHKHIPPERYR
jgi:hypothetical protein